ncbi:hypothetical protein Rhe02_54640 [Rhizocola hellebori]|uniref:Uncharacterized protein n=1 Tax=Rhizocola hellebori TaxID=1392758 RepID=A0A8J3QCC6_9ACTN|nr:hypothetical protein [Rhizocola hellebori]GIH07397.1 hypothetical protein Rhe02_54640 [Rhizocola hellebori]
MNDDPQVHAHLGLVRIPAGSCCEGQRWEEYTPDTARALAVELILHASIADNQLAEIAAACAQGHDWGNGWNTTHLGEKITTYACNREGCDGRRHDPGWLPFEPKQHLVPYSPKLWDCTGPGCEWCGNESFAAAFRKVMADGAKRLDEALFAEPMLATGGLVTGLPFRVGERDSCHPLTADDLKAVRDRILGKDVKLVEATGPSGITVRFDPGVPVDTAFALGSCRCGCVDANHDDFGCNTSGCACHTSIDQLVVKVTGIGEDA